MKMYVPLVYLLMMNMNDRVMVNGDDDDHYYYDHRHHQIRYRVQMNYDIHDYSYFHLDHHHHHRRYFDNEDFEN